MTPMRAETWRGSTLQRTVRGHHDLVPAEPAPDAPVLGTPAHATACGSGHVRVGARWPGGARAIRRPLTMTTTAPLPWSASATRAARRRRPTATGHPRIPRPAVSVVIGTK